MTPFVELATVNSGQPSPRLRSASPMGDDDNIEGIPLVEFSPDLNPED